jgi:hypothetical protein
MELDGDNRALVRHVRDGAELASLTGGVEVLLPELLD